MISRDNRGRSYEIAGTPSDEAKGQIREIVEKVVGDRHTAEWLP